MLATFKCGDHLFCPQIFFPPVLAFAGSIRALPLNAADPDRNPASPERATRIPTCLRGMEPRKSRSPAPHPPDPPVLQANACKPRVGAERVSDMVGPTPPHTLFGLPGGRSDMVSTRQRRGAASGGWNPRSLPFRAASSAAVGTSHKTRAPTASIKLPDTPAPCAWTTLCTTIDRFYQVVPTSVAAAHRSRAPGNRLLTRRRSRSAPLSWCSRGPGVPLPLTQADLCTAKAPEPAS